MELELNALEGMEISIHCSVGLSFTSYRDGKTKHTQKSLILIYIISSLNGFVNMGPLSSK